MTWGRLWPGGAIGLLAGGKVALVVITEPSDVPGIPGLAAAATFG